MLDRNNLEVVSWQGTVAVAERLWSPTPANITLAVADAEPRMAAQSCHMSVTRGLRVGPVNAAFCPSDWVEPADADTCGAHA